MFFWGAICCVGRFCRGQIGARAVGFGARRRVGPDVNATSVLGPGGGFESSIETAWRLAGPRFVADKRIPPESSILINPPTRQSDLLPRDAIADADADAVEDDQPLCVTVAMESAQYSRLPALPDPDSFELEPDYFELEKLVLHPQTRTARLRKWARRNALFVGLVALFLTVATLYIATTLSARPGLGLLGRPPGASLKQAIEEQPTERPKIVETDKGIMLEEGPDKTEIEGGQGPINQGDVVEVQGTGNNGNVTLDVPGADVVSEDNKGQASLQGQPPKQEDPPEPLIPIKAVFYSGSEGPKTCRGHVLAVIDLPKPAGLGVTGEAQCYNFPGEQYSGCANFMANKVDGCAAKVFGDTNCRTYLNTAAFMAEDRAVGGHWRSVEVQCGIPEPDPATLGKPPMMDKISGMVDNDKAKGGKRQAGSDEQP